jgi:GTP cyclohydrolase II
MSTVPLAHEVEPHYAGQPGDRIVFPNGLEVEVFARANLPTVHGDFEMVAFRNNRDGKDHVAFVRGDLVGAEGVYARVHSECLTGDVFGSIKCDCRAQLETAIADVASLPAGVILYMRQEGRGIGLANKIKAYSLQDRGLDTVEANHHLGFDDDLRTYDIASAMVHLLGVRSVALSTNNPNKIRGLREHGVRVEERIAIETQPTRHNLRYLMTKKRKSGHMLSV